MDNKRLASELLKLAKSLTGGVVPGVPDGTGPMGDMDECQLNDDEVISASFSKLAKSLTMERKASVVYTVPFKNYGGQLVGIPNIKKAVEKAVDDYDIHSEVVGLIMRSLRKEVQDIDDEGEVKVSFQVPIFIKKGRDGEVRIQFQT